METAEKFDVVDHRQHPFVMIDVRVIAMAGQIGATAFLVYAALCQFVNQKRAATGDRRVWPSLTVLSERLALHRETVVTALRTLEAAHLITATRVSGGQQHNTYSLLPIPAEGSEIPTTHPPIIDPPQSEIPTPAVGKSDGQQSENPTVSSRQFRLELDGCNQTEENKTKGNKKKTAARKSAPRSTPSRPTLIPDLFPLTDKLRTYYADHGCWDPERFHEHFEQTNRAKGYRNLDWGLAAMVWCRTSHDPGAEPWQRCPCQPRNASQGRRVGDKPTKRDIGIEVYEELMAAKQRRTQA